MFVVHVLHPPVHRMNHKSAHSLLVMPHFVLTMSSNVCRRFNSFEKNRKKCFDLYIVCVERYPGQCGMRDREKGKKMDKKIDLLNRQKRYQTLKEGFVRCSCFKLNAFM